MRERLLTGFLVLVLVSTSISAFGITVQKEEININEKENCEINSELIILKKESYKDLCNFFREEKPFLYSIIRYSLNKATVSDEENLVKLDSNVLEKQFSMISLIFGIKIRFWRQVLINSDKGDYYNVRNPFDDPYRDNDYSIRWSFKSDSFEIDCYENWRNIQGEAPEPIGNPSFNAKRVWFHEWSPGWRYDWEDVKLGGLVELVFAIGNNPYYSNLMAFYQNCLQVISK